ncbi:MAG: HEPN domain-containing protein [Microgenomates group bacterium Gr01-1014_16]|nr:MAG: HEPN domain-containing protein [Microgenomates group bacterium Gr01-1014_16]
MAASGKELRKIAKARLKTAKILLEAGDWNGSVYMMGYALECALKASACKALHLTTYPENTRNEKIDTYFMTHKFDQLLIVSGLSDIFGFKGKSEAFRNWSEFTIEYPGDWPSMRYDPKLRWDEVKTRKLYNNLVDLSNGVIATIKRRHKW